MSGCTSDPPSFCLPKCEIVDGEDCDETDDLSCSAMSCAIEGLCTRPTRKVYQGGTEKICSPRGCVGDCTDDVKVCYKVYECVPSEVPAYFSVCSSVYCWPGAGCWPKGYYSCEGVVLPNRCYGCEQGEEQVSKRHYVHNDSCSG